MWTKRGTSRKYRCKSCCVDTAGRYTSQLVAAAERQEVQKVEKRFADAVVSVEYVLSVRVASRRTKV